MNPCPTPVNQRHPLFKKNVCLFLTALGLHCCAKALSGCSEGGCSLVSALGLLIAVASLVAEHGVQSAGFSNCGTPAQLPHSMWNLPQTRDRTHIPCTGSWILKSPDHREGQHPLSYLFYILGFYGDIILKAQFFCLKKCSYWLIGFLAHSFLRDVNQHDSSLQFSSGRESRRGLKHWIAQYLLLSLGSIRTMKLEESRLQKIRVLKYLHFLPTVIRAPSLPPFFAV